MSDEPYHEGEIALQERAGERDIARRHGAIVSPRIVPGALGFLARQRLIAVSVAGPDEDLWTSVWCGASGFVHSEDGRRVCIVRPSMSPSTGDPVLSRIAIGRAVGILAIDLGTRRRLRINGMVDQLSDHEIGIRVRESVPNCPKYIQRRQASGHAMARSGTGAVARGRTLDDERRALVERADTAFVGSVHPASGADASHRGGAPGFIRVVDPATLRVPDYSGNSMFLTLGNFAIDSRASLAVLDFDGRRLLSFSGTARLHFGVDDPRQPTGGTGRYWDLAVREWVQYELPCAERWELLDASPFNPLPAGG